MEGRWKRGDSLPGLPAHLYELFPDRLVDSELGEIPEGWRVTTIDEEFDVTMGQSPPGNTYNELDNGIPFYQGSTDFTFRFPKRRIYCSAPTRLAQLGDTLLSVRAPVGDINMAIENCAIGRGLAAIRHKKSGKSYTYQFIKSISNLFSKFNDEGTVFGSIGKKDLCSIAYVAPPGRLVIGYEEIIGSLDDRIEKNVVESICLENNKESLITKLILGEKI